MTLHFHRQKTTQSTLQSEKKNRNSHVRDIFFFRLSYFVSGIQMPFEDMFVCLFVCVLSLVDYAKPLASRRIENFWIPVLRVTGRYGDRIPVGAKFSAPVQTGPGA